MGLSPRPNTDRSQDLYGIGRLAGLAVWFQIPLPIPLNGITCKFLLGQSIGPDDVARVDPDFYRFRVQPLLIDGGVNKMNEDLGYLLKFVSAPSIHQSNPADLQPSKPLRPWETLETASLVTEENKKEYLKLLCEHYLVGDMRHEINLFLEGFWDIFPKKELIDA